MRWLQPFVFAPQYPDLYADLNGLLPAGEIEGFVPSVIKASTLNDKLVMLPRAQFDVSALYYQKSLYEDDAKKTAFKEKYGYDLAPPKTWKEVSDQAVFFADPPNFYGTQFAGKEEAINGRFYEMLVAEGGEYLKDGKPAFNSEAGVRALDWFVNLYRPRPFLPVRPTICGMNWARALLPAPSRSIWIGRAGRPTSTIRSRRRSLAMSASFQRRPVLPASAPAGRVIMVSR